jgi:hypothetical protein
MIVRQHKFHVEPDQLENVQDVAGPVGDFPPHTLILHSRISVKHVFLHGLTFSPALSHLHLSLLALTPGMRIPGRHLSCTHVTPLTPDRASLSAHRPARPKLTASRAVDLKYR